MLQKLKKEKLCLLLSAAFRIKTDTFTNEYLVICLESLLGHPVLIRLFSSSTRSAAVLLKFAIVVQLMS